MAPIVFDWLASLDRILVPLQLILAMAGMGATMVLGDFRSVAKDPLGLGLGVGLQVVGVPLLAIAFAQVLGLERGWAVGLLLVAVVPGGAFSNLLTFFGRGNVPLSISITTVTTLGCIVTAPLLLRLTAKSHLPTDFAFPTQRIIFEIFAYLLIPLALGMLLRRLVPSRAAALSKWFIRGALLLILMIALGALGSGKIRVIEYGLLPPLVLLAFGATLAILTPQLLRVLGRYDDDTVAITIEVTVRNIGVALLLVHFFFPGQPEQGHVLFSALFYAGAAPAFALPIMFRHRLGRRAVLFRKPRPRPQTP